jgi:hypothetical protein
MILAGIWFACSAATALICGALALWGWLAGSGFLVGLAAWSALVCVPLGPIPWTIALYEFARGPR